MTKESIWFIYLWPFSHLTFSTSEEKSASNSTFVDELFVYYISQRLSSWFPICTYIKTRKNRWACTFSLIALCFLTLYLNRKMPSSFGLGNYSESNVRGKKRKEKTNFFENKLFRKQACFSFLQNSVWFICVLSGRPPLLSQCL